MRCQCRVSGKRALHTFEDIWRVELVWVALFGDGYLFAELKEGGPGGEVGDAAGHDYEELWFPSQPSFGCMDRMIGLPFVSHLVVGLCGPYARDPAAFALPLSQAVVLGDKCR